jgi:hypothetical protein
MDRTEEIQGGINILTIYGGTPLFITLIIGSFACIFVSVILTRNKMFEYSAQNPF